MQTKYTDCWFGFIKVSRSVIFQPLCLNDHSFFFSPMYTVPLYELYIASDSQLDGSLMLWAQYTILDL